MPRRRHAGTDRRPGDDGRRGRREGVRRHDVDVLAGTRLLQRTSSTPRPSELLDGEEGALPRSFEEFKVELEQLLDGTFDPDSKRSALAKLEEVMRRAAAEQVKAVRGADRPRQRGEPARPLPQRDREERPRRDRQGAQGRPGADDSARGRRGAGRDVRADDEEGLHLRGRARARR